MITQLDTGIPNRLLVVPMGATSFDNMNMYMRFLDASIQYRATIRFNEFITEYRDVILTELFKLYPSVIMSPITYQLI